MKWCSMNLALTSLLLLGLSYIVPLLLIGVESMSVWCGIYVICGSLTFGDIIIFPLAVWMIARVAGWLANISIMMVRFGLWVKHYD